MQVVVICPTIQEFQGIRYYLCGKYFQRKGVRLHLIVWKAHHGPIPKGYDIHHKDLNRGNNQPENLEAQKEGVHMSAHMRAPERKAQCRENVKKAQIAAPKWHKGKAGHVWHKQHFEESSRAIFAQQVEKVCEWCKMLFSTNWSCRNRARFCSQNCRAAERRASGVDNEKRTCPYCGKEFEVSKYETTVCCSHLCGKRYEFHGSLKTSVKGV